uniref:Ig-like domain-containing protein n=1 Tax=Cyprinus carpio TaxID=7962 RepID=A0A8C2DJN0_CYPCA
MSILYLIILLYAKQCLHLSGFLQPGNSLTLTCEVSGYSVTDDSYATAWIRQPAGKALEWITHIWGGGSITKKDSLSNKFSISKSDSSNTVTLKGQNLQTEDTAVYYCARRPQHEKTAQALYMNYYSQHPLHV